jgi:hypothetical protein
MNRRCALRKVPFTDESGRALPVEVRRHAKYSSTFQEATSGIGSGSTHHDEHLASRVLRSSELQKLPPNKNIDQLISETSEK